MAGRKKPPFRKYDTVFHKTLHAVKVVARNPVKGTDGVWRMKVDRPPIMSGFGQYVKCDEWDIVDRPFYRKIFNGENKMKLTKPAIFTLIALVVVFIVGMTFSTNYNSLVSSKAAVDNSWAKVETQYQRRFDLIGNVVESVKGSQAQESKVFKDIADGRKTYANAETTSEKAEAAANLETTIAMLPRLQEAYPELKSNEQVSKLIAELQGTENTIAGVRDTYNDTTTNYNVNIASFPKNVFAGMFGFEKQELFKADKGASKAPEVKFQ